MCPEHLYEEVVEVKERVTIQQNNCQLEKQCPVFTGTNGEIVRIMIIS